MGLPPGTELMSLVVAVGQRARRRPAGQCSNGTAPHSLPVHGAEGPQYEGPVKAEGRVITSLARRVGGKAQGRSKAAILLQELPDPRPSHAGISLLYKTIITIS